MLEWHNIIALSWLRCTTKDYEDYSVRVNHSRKVKLKNTIFILFLISVCGSPYFFSVLPFRVYFSPVAPAVNNSYS